MPDTLKVPLLNDLAPDGFTYGGHYIVEFDPDSLWYETSLTIAALALKQGTKTEYHVFQHFPSEAMDALTKLGVDAKKLEEEGLLGSHAYAVNHRHELGKAAGVVIYDSGTGKTTGFSVGGRKDVLDTAWGLIAPLAPFDVKELKPEMETGTDHFDFMLEGVPTFVAEQQEANYLENYHAVSDTYDKVDLAQLKKHVAEAAALSVGLANLPEKIGPRLTHDQIEQTMRDTNGVDLLKANGIWDDWVSGKRGRQK